MRLIVAVLSLLFAVATSAASNPASFEEKAFSQLLGAVEKGSYEEFIALGDARFKTMPESDFTKTADKFRPLLKAGYKASYIGAFREEGPVRVHYWRLEIPSEPHDWLAKLAVSDGKVVGFFITRP